MNKMHLLLLAGFICPFMLFAGELTAEKLSNSSNGVSKLSDVTDVQADASINTISIDIEAGQKLYKKTCKNCHGPTAKGMASFPKLVDKDAAYLIERLTQYRAGEQVGPNTPLMAPQAVKLSDEDISNISYYIVSLKK